MALLVNEIFSGHMDLVNKYDKKGINENKFQNLFDKYVESHQIIKSTEYTMDIVFLKYEKEILYKEDGVFLPPLTHLPLI